MLLSEGQMSDHTGAKLLYPALPPADTLIADKGYDSDEFREALAARNIEACIPPKRNRKDPAFLRQATLQDPPQDREHVRQDSRTGGASQPATTAAPTPSSPPSASQPAVIFYLNQ